MRQGVLEAREERAIAHLLQSAIADISDEEMRTLPEECRGALAAGDIHSAAVMLLRSDLAHRGEPVMGELLRQLAELYATASVRLSLIEHHRIR